MVPPQPSTHRQAATFLDRHHRRTYDTTAESITCKRLLASHDADKKIKTPTRPNITF